LTYAQIKDDFKKKTNLTCASCWIADRKNALGFTMTPSPNRGPEYPKKPCPKKHRKVLDKLIKQYYGN